MICYPNAKINIGLHVINKRADGFHNIETIFYPIGFSEILECVENKTYAKADKCVFVSHGLTINGNTDTNLVVKAYKLLDKEFNLPPVIVHLLKQLPMGAGLGGGSSDAAFMLNSLNNLFSLNLTSTQLQNYAAQLGSDCAFFIENKPAYVFGKGHELEPINFSLQGYYLVLINSGAHSNTAMAYKHAKRRKKMELNHNLKHIVNQPIETWKQNLGNDFEFSVFQSIPELAQIKTWLYDSGAFYASMSGSGASMFGLFKQKPNLKGKWSKHIVYEGIL